MWVVVEVVYVGRDWVRYGLQQVWNWLVHHMHGRLRGCTGPPVIALPLKYELMCETTFPGSSSISNRNESWLEPRRGGSDEGVASNIVLTGWSVP